MPNRNSEKDDLSRERTEGLASLLVPTDFTYRALWAAQRAAQLPLSGEAKIRLAHVLPETVPPSLRESAEREAQRLLRPVAKATSAAARKAGNRADVQCVVLFGKPYVEIIREARTVQASLIVMGRHGQRSIPSLLLGSTAERVVRYGSTPVLVVSRRPRSPYRRPLVAVALEDTAYATVRLALRVLPRAISRVSVLHAFHLPRQLEGHRPEIQKETRLRLERFVESLGSGSVPWAAVLRYGEPKLAILREIEMTRADVVVLGTHGRSGLAHALLGSVAEGVLRAAACDVLIGRPEPFSFSLP